QHELLLAQAAQLTDTISAVERLMDAHRKGMQLTAAEQSEIFGTNAFDDDYAAEAEERWGHTDAWEQSRQRVSEYTKQDWLDVKAEGDALLADLAQAKRDGVAPGSARAGELRERHRRSIQRFYDCDDEMQRCLARMYVADNRFTSYYDDVEPGLAQFVHDVIVAGRDAC
ncbi:MerR family transcriptional regulator, partial [Mycobacterium sp. ITM-2017-0098]